MLKIPSFILEGDVSSIIKLIYDKEDLVLSLGLITEDIHLVLLDQHVVTVLWIPREANKVVHCVNSSYRYCQPLRNSMEFPSKLCQVNHTRRFHQFH